MFRNMGKKNTIGRWKRNRELKLPWRHGLLSLFLILIMASCSTTPKVSFQGYIPADKKLTMRVALIISDELKNALHTDDIRSSCIALYVRSGGFIEYRTLREGVMRIRNTVGAATEELFNKGMPYLFKKVDIYESASRIKNKDSYDYILIPDFTVTTSYDKKNAFDRRVWQKNYGGSAILEQGTPLSIGASAELRLDMIDPKTDEVITTFIGKGISSKNWATSEATCSGFDPKSYNLRLSESYQRPIGEAMTAAFENLLRATDVGLRPPDISLNVHFSDETSLLPDNLLDVGEDAEILIAVKNSGKGVGYGTSLEVASDSSKVTFEKNIKMGDIAPGETRNLKIPLKAAANIDDGMVNFRFNLKEKRGYSQKEVLLHVSTSNQLNRIVDSIASKVLSSMKQKGWNRIALAEIESRGFHSNLEKYLQSEVRQRFAHKKDLLVEKTQIDGALATLKTDFRTLVQSDFKADVVDDADLVKRFGDLADIDAILDITVEETKTTITINANLVDSSRKGSGEIYTVASEEVVKGNEVFVRAE